MTGTSDLAMLLRVVASLVVVIVLAALAARLAKRASQHGSGVGLQVLDRAGLSRDASVAVVEVGGRMLVLGVTAHGVTILSELDADAVAARAREQASTPETPASAQSSAHSSAHSSANGAVNALSANAARRGSGSPLDPRTWRQGLEALRNLTVRR